MALFTSASEAQFLFEISGIELGVVDFTAREEISSLYEADLSVASQDEINFDDVIGREALLTLVGDETDRYIHGIVNEFRQTGSRGRFYLYQTRMVPSLWLLSLEQDCRVFQNKKVPDIVKEVLEESGITSEHFAFRLQAQYPEREYCVQYRETDLNFISRLLEEEGIFYFFEHANDKHLLVFGDGAVDYQPIQGEANVVFRTATAMVPEEEHVNSFAFCRQIHCGKITLRDFNFEKPALDLTADKQADYFQTLELYDYPGEYYDEARGKTLTQIRLQEATMFRDRVEGQSVCPRFTPGFTFGLVDHEREDFNEEYLLAEVSHTGSQPQTLEEQTSEGAGSSYSNLFLGIPHTVTFRPERKTPKPIVEGIQTAIVVGEQNDGDPYSSSPEEIYTDKYGRVKVQFHWDRRGNWDKNSSCWIRVNQTWAGSGMGSMFIPRKGHEVIVDFVEGDPDRPVITGRVYHGTNMPPYDLPAEKTKSTVKSSTSPDGGGFNEIRFEDKKGEEQVFIHAQKDMSEKIENNMSTSVGANQSISVGGNRSVTVQKNETITISGKRTEKVTQSDTITIDDKRSITIGKGDTISVKTGDRSTTVASGNEMVFVNTGNRSVNVAENNDVSANQASITTDTMTLFITGTSEVKLQPGELAITASKISISGTQEVKIGVANSAITINAQGISSSAPKINTTAVGIHEISGALIKIN